MFRLISRLNIYYTSDFDLEGKQIIKSEINSTIDGKTVSANKLIIKNQPELSNQTCYYEKISSDCLPILEQGKLYSDSDQKYFLIIKNDLPDKDKEFSFFVAAVDLSGKEIEIVKNSKKSSISDNLAPSKPEFSLTHRKDSNEIVVSIAAPKSNVDNSAFREKSDVSSFYIFAKSDDCDDIVSTKYYAARSEKNNDEVVLQLIESRPIEKINYCVAVIAADGSNNPISFTQKSTDKELIVKESYTKILKDLSNPQMIKID